MQRENFMGNTLHILNGDRFKSVFSATGIEGDVLIWREMLCEGSLHPDVGSDEFWKKRYAFFETAYGVEKIEYFDATIKELIRIEDLSGYTEVVLWFDFDLFCQINMIGALSYLLKHYKKDIRYYLVCAGEHRRRILSDCPKETLVKLYEKRTKLSRNDIRFADAAWKIFTKNNPEQLKAFDFGQNKKFRCLGPAIAQHMKRFPDESGLNEIQRKIVELLELGLEDEELLNALFSWQKEETVYGFGDIQYRKMIEDFTQKRMNLL